MKKRTITLTLLLDAAVLAAAATAPFLSRCLIDWLPDCPLRQFGLLCPACGGTRCVGAFFRGEWAEAFLLNPAVFLLIWYAAVLLLLVNLQPVTERVRPVVKGMIHPCTVVCLAVAFALFGIFRNL